MGNINVNNWHDVTNDGNCPRITKLGKTPLNFTFQHFTVLLSKSIMQIHLYCSKLLETVVHQFCDKPLHITFKI